MNNLRNIEVDEISLLGKNSRPAVSGAIVTIAKSEAGGFLVKVAEIRQRDGLSRTAALSKAAAEHPAALAAFRKAAPTDSPDEPDADDLARAKAKRTFLEHTAAIVARDGCARHIAMSRAVREHPEVHAAAFG